MMHAPENIRNLAIVAHIDHGKTTLIDAIFKAAHVFRDNQRVAERVMDSNDLEKERGITIRAKHCTVSWGEHLINIIDTPGHADFSGEVERVLSMVDTVLLLVDANEGPMPQTRYVLMRALRLGMKPIVIVNKVDRPHADPQRVLNETFDLFLELGANDEQAEFAVLYGSALHGWMARKPDAGPDAGMDALFEMVIERVPPPVVERDSPFRMQVSTLAWSDYIGRIGCGRVLAGKAKLNDVVRQTRVEWDSDDRREQNWHVVSEKETRLAHLWVSRGLEREAVEEAGAGDIIWFAGPEEINIGDTLASPEFVDAALKPLEIEQPTVSMFFLVNTGPFAGQEGKAYTLRQLRERLMREIRTNVALKVEDLGRQDGLKVSGRGELHLGILIEEMRREGLELCVSRPEVITKLDDNGSTLEPMEEVVIEVPTEYQGVVIEKLAKRKGELRNMNNGGTGVLRLEFEIPTRGLIGYRNEFLTDTRGLGIMYARFIGYGPWRGEVVSRNRGSMIATDTGESTGYSLENLQIRGTLFIGVLEQIYAGMVIGEHSRPEDMTCNPTKRKNLTNHRSANKELDAPLQVPRRFTLEGALEWIAEDELVEITPKSVRVRKAILDFETRKRAEKKMDMLSVK